MEVFSVEGQWWLPGKRDDAVAGKLCESEGGGLTLQLQGTFTKDLNLVLNMVKQRHPIIQGVTANAKMMTLANCFSLGGHMGFPGYAQENYSIGSAYVGGLFENEGDLAFDEAQVTFPYLFNWLARPIYTVQTSPAPFDSISCTYKRPPDIEVMHRGGSLRICSIVSYHEDPFGELKLNYTPVIVVNAGKRLTLTEWEERYLQPLRDFLTFATRHVVHFSSLELSCKDRLNQSGHPAAIEVVLPGSRQPDSPTKYLHPLKILFGASDVGSRLGNILDQWLTKYEELKNVMMLFFGPLYNEHMYLEHQFLNLAYATETYHRVRHPGHAKKIFFKDRLFSLLTNFEEPLKLFPIDLQQFSEKVTHTRNFYVHYDDSHRDKAANGEALFRMVQVLQCLIEVCLLSELDFDLAVIKALLERNENLKFTARMIGKTPGLFA